VPVESAASPPGKVPPGDSDQMLESGSGQLSVRAKEPASSKHSPIPATDCA